MECLPPLYNPRILDVDNLRQFAFKFEETNLEFVEDFENVLTDEQTMHFLKTKDPFLHRCRSLRKVDIITYGEEDLFERAVQEKQEYDRAQSQGETSTNPLVPVEQVGIRFDHPRHSSTIDSIALGFGDTLESLSASCEIVADLLTEFDEPSVLFGHLWNLPRLRSLSVRAGIIAVILNPEALLGCPNLQEVTLLDKSCHHIWTAIHPWRAASLPELRSLKLSGTAARTFHPDILHTTPKLEVLHVSMGSDDWVYERPVRSHILHMLPTTSAAGAGSVDTTGSFQILRTTPNPEALSLDLKEIALFLVPGLELRQLSVDDLRRDDDNDDMSRGRFILLPKLINLQVVVDWDIAVEFWEAAFTHVMPNLLSSGPLAATAISAAPAEIPVSNNSTIRYDSLKFVFSFD
ncbi:hypothetical protein BGW39_008020 [Mortierella sp. 14UC]|nr:hypothetical protein BGW39_008020 [Mortierella sp. 14UC]